MRRVVNAVNVAMASLLDVQQQCALLCVRAAGSCSGGRLPHDLPTAVEEYNFVSEAAASGAELRHLGSARMVHRQTPDHGACVLAAGRRTTFWRRSGTCRARWRSWRTGAAALLTAPTRTIRRQEHLDDNSRCATEERCPRGVVACPCRQSAVGREVPRQNACTSAGTVGSLLTRC